MKTNMFMFLSSSKNPFSFFIILSFCTSGLFAQGVNIPAGHYGISIGNSTRFTGLRINFMDKDIEQINGANITVWSPIRGVNISGIEIAPVFHHVKSNDPDEIPSFNGLSVSPVNLIQGTQRGLSIGVVNIADELQGIQLGLINIARSNRKGMRVLPVFNAAFR